MRNVSDYQTISGRVAIVALVGILLAGCPLRFPRTYVSAAGDVAIPDPGAVQSPIYVPHSFTVTDVNVTMNVTHPRLGDCDVALFSPSGTPMPLFFLIGGADLVDTTIDDEAAATIDTGTAPYTGSWQIDSNLTNAALSVFDGENARGVWTLVFTDQGSPNAGTFHGWSITFNTP
jgi:subtilisin-like proprotein convertase family protein